MKEVQQVFEDLKTKLFGGGEKAEMKSYELEDGKTMKTDSEEEIKAGQKATIDGEPVKGTVTLKSGKKIKFKEGGEIEEVEDEMDKVTSLEAEIEAKDKEILELKATVEGFKEENKEFKSSMLEEMTTMLALVKEDSEKQLSELKAGYEEKITEMAGKVEKIEGNAVKMVQDVNTELELDNPRETEVKAMSIAEVRKLRNESKIK